MPAITTSPMTPALAAKLDRLRHFATRYEAVLTSPCGARLLVGYTPRRSKAGLLAAISNVGPAILARFTIPDDARMTCKAGAFAIGSTGITIAFSGRTQRDAYCSGELAFIGAGAPAPVGVS